MSQREKILGYLNSEFTRPVRDTVWQHIYLTPGLVEVINSAPFQQLHHIKQLGPVYLVYPGAVHSRFSHSLGVYHLARKIIHCLVIKDPATTFTLKEVKAFLCAALLHDIGHYPFAHALKDLPVERHEKLTAEIILSPPLKEILIKTVGTSPELVAAIIHPEKRQSPGENLHFFRNLLSGVLDPDKLDYLNRDAYYCGIPYGIQDVDFIFNQINSKKSILSISSGGLIAIENILFSKYLMYRSVYWHKTVRIATAMIKKAVNMGLARGEIAPGDLYGLTDQDFFTLPRKHNFPPFALMDEVFNRRLYKRVHCTPFNPSNPLHRQLENLEFRLNFEADLTAQVSRQQGISPGERDIIIDIPEKVDFEIQFPVLREDGYTEYASLSVFNKEVVANFTRSLRFITLSVPPGSPLESYFRRQGKDIFGKEVSDG